MWRDLRSVIKLIPSHNYKRLSKLRLEIKYIGEDKALYYYNISLVPYHLGKIHYGQATIVPDKFPARWFTYWLSAEPRLDVYITDEQLFTLLFANKK